MGASGEQGAHHRGVVAPVGACEFEGELVLRVQVAAPGEVPAQQRARAGSDDELVAGVVASAAEHRALHRGEDVSFEGAGTAEPHRLVPRIVGQRRRPAGVLDLPRALHRPEPVDQGRGVGERAAPGELRFHQAPVVRLEPEGIELHPEPGAPEPQLVEQRPQIAGGVHALGVLPDADVLDVRGMPRLAEIREPCEQGHATVGLHDQALEQAEAEGVVAGEPVHGLLLEAEQRVEPGTADGRRGALAPSRHLFGAEMDRHVGRSSVQEGGGRRFAVRRNRARRRGSLPRRSGSVASGPVYREPSGRCPMDSITVGPTEHEYGLAQCPREARTSRLNCRRRFRKRRRPACKGPRLRSPKALPAQAGSLPPPSSAPATRSSTRSRTSPWSAGAAFSSAAWRICSMNSCHDSFPLFASSASLTTASTSHLTDRACT